ncbi:hypothetical protein GIB67_039974, partial [Kingdonia uniflora]
NQSIHHPNQSIHPLNPNPEIKYTPWEGVAVSGKGDDESLHAVAPRSSLSIHGPKSAIRRGNYGPKSSEREGI